jgi:hypothetical protein
VEQKLTSGLWLINQIIKGKRIISAAQGASAILTKNHSDLLFTKNTALNICIISSHPPDQGWLISVQLPLEKM